MEEERQIKITAGIKAQEEIAKMMQQELKAFTELGISTKKKNVVISTSRQMGKFSLIDAMRAHQIQQNLAMDSLYKQMITKKLPSNKPYTRQSLEEIIAEIWGRKPLTIYQSHKKYLQTTLKLLNLCSTEKK